MRHADADETPMQNGNQLGLISRAGVAGDGEQRFVFVT